MLSKGPRTGNRPSVFGYIRYSGNRCRCACSKLRNSPWRQATMAPSVPSPKQWHFLAAEHAGISNAIPRPSGSSQPLPLTGRCRSARVRLPLRPEVRDESPQRARHKLIKFASLAAPRRLASGLRWPRWPPRNQHTDYLNLRGNRDPDASRRARTTARTSRVSEPSRVVRSLGRLTCRRPPAPSSTPLSRRMLCRTSRRLLNDWQRAGS